MIAIEFVKYLDRDVFKDTEELQRAVAEIGKEDFEYILERLWDELEVPESIPKSIKRFKVCGQCGKPFYATSRQNRDLYCHHEPYRRHQVLDGKPYKLALKGWSSCQVAAERERMRHNRKYRGF